ncbi:isoprenylcysteine carboxylmethyltransferase family protein [Aliidiomarina halalkaliphila]|uniref:Isoprenylcysteine carboxylmethyltransferase family protein n=1 Tax=Aliidiomarina halalkaliphila TaxID=2593535 RepID=A0A552WYQ9_9GAMM|nr:isoprenylcysteine carboxylmethyltransferase family protein [Aliidiomarina halalkaliphila]TRW47961.1 isoprenylcysteine carboxylmethyltransferase family protein [Aliidiomarina halalkaliphila]
MNSLELKIPPVLLVLIFVADMLILRWLFPRPEFGFTGQLYVSVGLVVVGIVLPALGFLQFYKHKTTVDPMHPEASSQIVQAGVYKHTRNPMYLGFLLLLCGLGVYLGNVASLVMLPLFVWYMNRFQILPEERILKEKFGHAYQQYKGRVRRWI